jgi:hypothetical protein
VCGTFKFLALLGVVRIYQPKIDHMGKGRVEFDFIGFRSKHPSRQTQEGKQEQKGKEWIHPLQD